jgi:NAD(P) transhydrogenase subunit alpha
VKIGVVRESAQGERRVALVPESVKRLIGKKHEIVVESGAGVASGASDDEYRKAGATVGSADDAWAADFVCKVAVPTEAEIGRVREGAALVSLLYPLVNRALVDKLAARKVTALSLDAIPRTTLAQMMDVLSSQATVAGYRAVLLAAEALPRMCPMLVTAAGTLAPARFLVLGAGVAGLQAIATARRLGAVVEAFDVRKVVKEQVESLGARFIEVPSTEDAQTASGYAKEVSEEYKQKQAALIAEALRRADACITTALIPGKRAPLLVPAAAARGMKPGSVIVDLAAEQGGNCELTRPGERYVDEASGVIIMGPQNLPSHLPVHASQMFSRNVEKLILHITTKEGALALDGSDEIKRGVVVTQGGAVVHPSFAPAQEKVA